jgi:serine phosphatase RsbU (regulator of sigma subunit)
VNDGDVVLFYTDALIEATNTSGEQLGEAGLLKIARSLATTTSAASIARSIIAGVREFTSGAQAQDDVTILAIRFAKKNKCRPTLLERLGSMSRLIGLRGSSYATP